MKVTGVRSQDLERVWPDVRKLIVNAQDRSLWTTISPEEIFSDLLCARRQLWITLDEDRVLRQAMITSIENNDGMVCRISCIAGGTEEDAINLFAVVEPWAMIHGCTKIEATTRPGGARKLERKGGYFCVGCVMQKEIYHG